MSTFERPRPITDSDDVSGFDCGQPSLNEWLFRRAVRNEQSGASRTFVTFEFGSGRVAGYYSLAAGSIEAGSASSRLRSNMPSPIPAILLGRFAIDLRYQGRGLAAALLRDAFSRAVIAGRSVGAATITVHAIDGAAAGFYAKFGFRHLPGDAHGAMYVLMSDVEASIRTLRQQSE